MSFDVEEYLHYQIANARLLSYPFAHFYIERIFPEYYYDELIATLPEQRYYKRLDETGTVAKGEYPERFVCDLVDAQRAEHERDGEAGIWTEIAKIFRGPEFAQCVLSSFNDSVVQRFGQKAELDFQVDCRLVRDFSNYEIRPHTDAPQKLVSLLFYMPPNDTMKDLGTSLFVPKDPSFRCDGRTHDHAFSSFRKVMTARYMPNSLLGFFKTDKAFHGVERIEQPRTQRDSILYNINVRRVGLPAT